MCLTRNCASLMYLCLSESHSCFTLLCSNALHPLFAKQADLVACMLDGDRVTLKMTGHAVQLYMT